MFWRLSSASVALAALTLKAGVKSIILLHVWTEVGTFPENLQPSSGMAPTSVVWLRDSTRGRDSGKKKQGLCCPWTAEYTSQTLSRCLLVVFQKTWVPASWKAHRVLSCATQLSAHCLPPVFWVLGFLVPMYKQPQDQWTLAQYGARCSDGLEDLLQEGTQGRTTVATW